MPLQSSTGEPIIRKAVDYQSVLMTKVGVFPESRAPVKHSGGN